MTTIVLPAPVSPVSDREPRIQLQRGVVDHAEALDPYLGQHGGSLRRVVVHRGRTAPTAHRKVELAHQAVGERSPVQPHHVHRPHASCDLDPGASWQREDASTVAIEHRR